MLQKTEQHPREVEDHQRLVQSSKQTRPKTNMIYAADEIDLLARSETKLVELIYTQASMYCVLTYTSN
jgi:hypothetical protein